MPELPEAEVAVCQLRDRVVGRDPGREDTDQDEADDNDDADPGGDGWFVSEDAHARLPLSTRLAQPWIDQN